MNQTTHRPTFIGGPFDGVEVATSDQHRVHAFVPYGLSHWAIYEQNECGSFFFLGFEPR